MDRPAIKSQENVTAARRQQCYITASYAAGLNGFNQNGQHVSLRILILDRDAHEYGERLRALFPNLTIEQAATIDHFRGRLDAIDVLVAFGLSVSDSILRQASALKWIQALGTGVDYFQRSPELRSDVILTSARGIHGPAMCENVIFLMQSLSRNSRHLVQLQKERAWKRTPWPLLHGKTVVILGTGVSGSAIAQGLKALGLTTIGVTRTPRSVDGFDQTVPIEDLVKVASAADYLVNVMPGGAANQNLICETTFQAMKTSAFFINVGRGDSVDEAALVHALDKGQIAGAALDVFRAEPLPAGSPLWATTNLLVTPHIGGLFTEYSARVVPLIAENIRCFLNGRFAEMTNVAAPVIDR